MKKMAIPAGFRFCPTGEELINSYLRPKIMGKILPCNVVEEKELYGGDPWDILKDANHWLVSETDKLGNAVKKTIYVFTKLTKKAAAAGKMRKNSGTGGKEQYIRAAGCGTWDGQTGPREVQNGKGEVIGYKKMLVFEIRSAAKSNPDGHWIMHEFSLAGGESDYVVCEIILDLKKISKRKIRGVDDDQEVAINPKRLLLTINGEEEKKDDHQENHVIIRTADVPVLVLHDDHEGSSSSCMEYVQTHEWEWDDICDLEALLDQEVPLMKTDEEKKDEETNVIICSDADDVPLVHEEAHPSGMADHELMPMTDQSQEQTLELEWDDFINLDELLNSEVPRFDSTPLTMESQEERLELEWEWDDLVKLDELLNSDVPRLDSIMHEFEETLHRDGDMHLQDNIN